MEKEVIINSLALDQNYKYQNICITHSYKHKEIGAYINTHIYISQLCLLKRPRGNDTPVTMSTRASRVWFLNTILKKEKEQGFLEKCIISGLEQGKYKISLKHLPMLKRNCSKIDENFKKKQEET